MFVPTAKTIVTIEDNASGIAATAIAIANINELAKSPPLITWTANIIADSKHIPTPNFLLNSSNFCWSGVCFPSALSSKSAILPTSVFIPVFVTINIPLP